MARQLVLVNFPVLVECEVESYDNAAEAWAKLDKTDALTLKNITVKDFSVAAIHASLLGPAAE